MKQEDLTKRLENLETPEIELPGHRQALRAALLRSDRFSKRTVMDWARVLAPVTAALALLVVVGFFNVVQPRLHIAQAREIARNDPQVQTLLEEYGLDITEVELRDGEAFVVLAPIPIARLTSPPDDACGKEADSWLWRIFRLLPSSSTDEGGSPEAGYADPPFGEGLSSAYVLKIDLAAKKVTGFGQVHEVTTLRDINLDEIDFAESAPSAAAAPEETDPD